MRLILLLVFVGFAAAFPHNAVDNAVEDMYHDFMLSLEDEYVFAEHNDIKSELGQKLREYLDEILEKIKDAVDHGKIVREDLQNKLKELKQKMKDLNIDLGDKAKELLQRIKEKSRDFLKNLLEKLGLKEDKDEVEQADVDLARLDFNLKDLFKKLKKALLSKIDKEKLKAKIEEIFGKGSDMADALEELINKKGDKYKQVLLDLVDRFVGKEDAQYSLSDYWQKIKDYFKDLHIDLKERYMKFGEYVKDVLKKGLDKSKSKLDNIKSIAKEFLDHTKGVSKEVAVEALEFLRPYRDDLGALYDQVRETVKDILKRQDAPQHSLSDYWQKIKDYFKDLHIDLKERYMKFGEYVKDVLKKGLDKSKSKLDNIKSIAKEFLDHTKGVSKEVAVEALEFLRPYRDDLGALYDQVRETVKDILKRQDAPQHSLSDYWQKIKDYFKDLHIDLKERYMKFGEYVKDVLKKGLDKSKSKLDNIKSIAKEFLDHTKGVSKEVAVEALEFLRPYRDDLGALYDQVRETVKDILQRKD